MTSSRKLRRHTAILAASISLLASGTGLYAARANADTVGSLQAEATAIANRISLLGQQEDQLSESYDQAVGDLQAARARVTAARHRVGTAEARAAAARGVLETEAVNAYISNGSGASDAAVKGVAGATSGLLREEYQQTLAATQADNEDRYKLASAEAATAESNLRTQEQAASAQVTKLAGARTAVSRTESQLVSEESLVKGRLATAVAARQAAIAAQQAREEQARIAAQRREEEATTTTTVASSGGGTGATTPTTAPTTGSTGTSGGGTTTTTTTPPTTGSGGSSGGGGVTSDPPPSSVAAAAVAAAESRVGDPYVWGAAGPSSFDCSGLVMWAYEQAGVSLPHFSGAQYADTTHISMADLEPGDIVFFADPGEHEAMYVGNGEIVEAPYTGADVHIVPMYSQFVLATRVS